jgi:hypothetical protein
MGGAQWNITPADAVRQEGYTKNRRLGMFVPLVVGLIGAAWLLLQAFLPKAAVDVPVASAIQSTVTVVVQIQVVTATPHVTPPGLRPAPTISIAQCRAVKDGDGYVKESLYTSAGWSQALGGQIYFAPLGWRPLTDFSCPGLASLPELSYGVPTRPAAIATRPPIPTATPTDVPAPVPPPPTATPTVAPLLLSWVCSAAPYLSNGTGLSLSAVALDTVWSTAMPPGGVLWLNPQGAQRWRLSTSVGSVDVQLRLGCVGGVVK